MLTFRLNFTQKGVRHYAVYVNGEFLTVYRNTGRGEPDYIDGQLAIQTWLRNNKLRKFSISDSMEDVRQMLESSGVQATRDFLELIR